jgi:DUF971 family protein
MDEDIRRWPTKISVRPNRQSFGIDFAEGGSFNIAAELLRVESPSAEVQGHDASEKRIVPGKAGVKITHVEPVGNYAVRIIFDDGHDTGLYSWDYLYKLGDEQTALITAYRAAL